VRDLMGHSRARAVARPMLYRAQEGVMPYLYGDSSPFPLEENFLETLRDVCDAVGALLKADGDLCAARQRAEDARRGALTEQAKLEGIAGGLVRVLESPMNDAGSPPTARAAGRVLQAARGVLESARGECNARRDEALRGVERELIEARAAVMKQIESLIARRQLPHTVWRLAWRAGAGDARATAQVEGTAPGGLVTTLELDVPAAHLWAHGVKVRQLDKGLIVHLPHEGGLLRKAGWRAVSLDGWYVTELVVSPERVALVVRTAAGGPAEGLELTVRDRGGLAPAARRMLKGGGATGEPIKLDAADARAVERLWRRVAETMRDLEKRRTRLLAATFAGKPLAALDRPAKLAQALVDAIAPITREIRKKSPAAAELCLKRDLGGGRREELFVPVADLERRLEAMHAAGRAVMAALGLRPGDGDEDLDALEAALAGATEDVEASELARLEAKELSDDLEEVDDEEETRDSGGRSSTPPVMVRPLPESVIATSEDDTGLDGPRGRIVN
jgi:hypothetical protein